MDLENPHTPSCIILCLSFEKINIEIHVSFDMSHQKTQE